jgi:hypothetical protein
MSQHRLRRGDLHPTHRRSQVTYGFKLEEALDAAHIDPPTGQLWCMRSYIDPDAANVRAIEE